MVGNEAGAPQLPRPRRRLVPTSSSELDPTSRTGTSPEIVDVTVTIRRNIFHPNGL